MKIVISAHTPAVEVSVGLFQAFFLEETYLFGALIEVHEMVVVLGIAGFIIAGIGGDVYCYARMYDGAARKAIHKRVKRCFGFQSDKLTLFFHIPAVAQSDIVIISL